MSPCLGDMSLKERTVHALAPVIRLRGDAECLPPTFFIQKETHERAVRTVHAAIKGELNPLRVEIFLTKRDELSDT